MLSELLRNEGSSDDGLALKATANEPMDMQAWALLVATAVRVTLPLVIPTTFAKKKLTVSLAVTRAALGTPVPVTGVKVPVAGTNVPVSATSVPVQLFLAAPSVS